MVSLEFALTSFWPHCGLGNDSATDRNDYQGSFLGGKGGRSVGPTTWTNLRANCLEILDSQPPGTLRPYTYVVLLFSKAKTII